MFVRKKRPAKRGRGSKAKKAAPRLRRPHLPQGLEQRHLDVIGLLLIAVVLLMPNGILGGLARLTGRRG